MPRLFTSVPLRVRWALMLLVALPCAPGMTFLSAGWLCDPAHKTGSQTFDMDRRATQQAHMLYRAGAATLGAGVLGGMIVGWKLVRRRDADPDEVQS